MGDRGRDVSGRPKSLPGWKLGKPGSLHRLHLRHSQLSPGTISGRRKGDSHPSPFTRRVSRR